VAEQVGSKQDVALASRMTLSVLGGPASADTLKRTALEKLAAILKPEIAPGWTPELLKALQTSLNSASDIVVGAVLPLVVRWDKKGAMTADLKPLIQKMADKVNDNSLADSERARVATSLLGVRQLNPEVVANVAQILGSGSSAALQQQVIEALGNTLDVAIGAPLVAAFPKLSADLQSLAFNQLIKRADWSQTLVRAIKEERISLTTLGPAAVHRLRTHSNREVAQRAGEVIDEIRGPEIKEKDALIAKLLPEVQKPGNAENGRQLFTQNCGTCHKFNGQGNDLAPDLTGMGAHGPAELLTHVLDPNRVVEPNFVAHSVETKDGLVFDGIVARENPASVVLRNAQGEIDLKRETIRSQRSTGLSLMPGGFESLGAAGLQDLLAYIRAGEGAFRVLDLGPAFTANSSRGIYGSEDAVNESLRFTRFGLVRVADVPFEVVSPTKSGTGNNVVVLKGGRGFAKTLNQRVEIKGGVAAKKLHFLGGVGGWAWPCCGDNKNENVPVAKVTVHYADQEREQIILRNGQEFADYNGKNDVPGSQEALGLVRYGQVRWFSKPLKRQAVIDRISLESYDNAVVPTFVAITAELAADASRRESLGSTGEPTAARAPSDSAAKVLIVGGGSAHNFQRWFNEADVATLKGIDGVEANYTEDVNSILPALSQLRVLYLSNNQPMTNKALRNGIFGFADSGRGLLLVHAANWYNWRDWPEYNRSLVSGGTRSHDKFGEFEVTVDEPGHPIMAGVPATFQISDELYHFQKDAEGPSIQVLATGKNSSSGKTYPVVWIVSHPKARIVSCTLGHDGAAHEHPAYQAILRNAVKWAARKE
jgi:putative heme-binding domain-containing protein